MSVVLKPENIAQRVFFIRDFMFELSEGGGEIVKIPIWKLEARPERKIPSSRLHRGGCRDALERVAQLARGRSEYRDYAPVCAAPTLNGQQRRSRAQDRRS